MTDKDKLPSTTLEPVYSYERLIEAGTLHTPSFKTLMKMTLLECAIHQQQRETQRELYTLIEALFP